MIKTIINKKGLHDEQDAHLFEEYSYRLNICI